MKRLLFFAALVVAAFSVIIGSAAAGSAPVKTSLVYNSIPANGPPSNSPSVGAEAYAFNEFGNEITLAGAARHLNSVSVNLSSWACVAGHWTTGDCSTPSGATFSLPMTLNIYNASSDGGLNPGSLIATVAQTFNVPYRPSASPRCTDGRWYSSGTKTCFNGLANTVTFSFSGVILPTTVVYGISYNTSHFGPVPEGEATSCYGTHAGCAYDSLNIALSQDPTDVTAGSDTNVGTVWHNSPYAGEYCDGGLAGTNSFRLDSPDSASCWGVQPPYDTSPFYVPAVQFKASK
jgi:hypothetical protein